MDTKAKETRHDLLTELSKLDKAELEARFSKKTVEAIRNLAFDILGIEGLNIHTPSDFSEYVYRLRKVEKIWNKRLGEAIISSSEKYDNGEVEIAVEIMSIFLQECPSPFLKEIANARKKAYTSGKLKRSDPIEKGWGVKAGGVLLDAQQSFEQGDKNKALFLLNDFIEQCPFEKYKKDVIKFKEELSRK